MRKYKICFLQPFLSAKTKCATFKSELNLQKKPDLNCWLLQRKIFWNTIFKNVWADYETESVAYERIHPYGTTMEFFRKRGKNYDFPQKMVFEKQRPFQAKAAEAAVSCCNLRNQQEAHFDVCSRELMKWEDIPHTTAYKAGWNFTTKDAEPPPPPIVA